MTEIVLSQQEADALIAMRKLAESSDPIVLPDLGGAIHVPLVSDDFHEKFLLDISRGRINLAKGTNQLRAHQVIILVRLDFAGPPHRNPDGEEIGCPHLHLYREGYADKWAYSIPDGVFSNIADPWQVLQDFMSYCNIVRPPNFQRGLFS